MLVTAQIGPIGEEVKVGQEKLEPAPQSPGGLCPVHNVFSTTSVLHNGVFDQSIYLLYAEYFFL